MKTIALILAILTGVSLFSLQVRHAGSFYKAIFGPFDKKLTDNIDAVDKIVLTVAGILFLLCLVFYILSV